MRLIIHIIRRGKIERLKRQLLASRTYKLVGGQMTFNCAFNADEVDLIVNNSFLDELLVRKKALITNGECYMRIRKFAERV